MASVESSSPRDDRRCVNYDWIELSAKEKVGEPPKDAKYFMKHGCPVLPREYGTRVFGEMFVIYEGLEPFCEIRRNPLSKKSKGGIMPDNLMSLRVVNRKCYEGDVMKKVRQFLSVYGFYDFKFSRLDICADFQRFDNGMLPFDFVREYMQGQWAKLHQVTLSAHGKDEWKTKNMNSLKWGSPESNCTTKLYNKSMEIREKSKKDYILKVWQNCHLQTEPALDVWRVEFSLRGAAKKLRARRDGIHVNLEWSNVDTLDKACFLWEGLATHYFDFRQVEYFPDGVTLKRKDRCRRADLFVPSICPHAFVAGPLPPYSDHQRALSSAIKEIERVDIPEPPSNWIEGTAQERQRYKTVSAARIRLQNAKISIIAALERERLQLVFDRKGATLLQDFLNRDEEGMSLNLETGELAPPPDLL